MATYSYRLRGSVEKDTIEGVIFYAGINNEYTSDQYSLNKWVPTKLERWIDGVPSNEDLTTEEERSRVLEFAAQGDLVTKTSLPTELAAMGRQRIRRSNLMAFGAKGRLQNWPFAGADRTAHFQMTLPHFDEIAVVILGCSPTPCVNVRAAVGVSNVLGADNSVETITPSGGWKNFLFGGVTNGTLPIGDLISTSFLQSDWLKLQSIQASDSAWAVTHLRIEIPNSGNTNAPQNVVVGGIETPINGHVYRQRSQDVAGVTTPSAFTSTATLAGGTIPFMLLLKSRFAGITILVSGDSIMEAWYNYAPQWARANSTPENPITVCQTACVGGSTSDQFTTRLGLLMPIVKPSVLLYSGWAVNTVSGTVSSSGINNMWKNISTAKGLCEDYRSTMLIATGQPINATFYDWAPPEDTLRLEFIASLKANANASAGQFIMDSNAALSGAANAKGQIEYASGLTTDGLHPNLAGHASNVPVFDAAMKAADA